MALVEYTCLECGSISYAFKGEEYRLPQSASGYRTAINHSCKWHALSPLCSIVHSTEIFMISQIDSIHSIHALDAAATREAADERELKAYNNARKEI
jgi:hypothetical protein